MDDVAARSARAAVAHRNAAAILQRLAGGRSVAKDGEDGGMSEVRRPPRRPPVGL
jgi:hypothetical protein